MIVVVPTPAPVTWPVPETVAIKVLLLLQVPPVVASERLMDSKLHTANVAPPIAPGNGFTDTGITV